MAKADNNRQGEYKEDESAGEDEYDVFELLERLESLREDMEELRVTTLTEVNRRIAELHQQLDED
ncbi:hypothetical protein EPA93_19590 [Ktedonosporobacter rubrisoli]|uniref:Uncharacterized protein n=1 Tax=Ktedonosporobacter rubrisoli TaxID=2509675 RepID=A0A4P6JRI6_KTERU|nr:hypothetical protein [Ktedonosporobacter rubrisoli]QBD78078.1 hypothetical protein EPA93_19590 [Ktedonosporobacter rubrisoli]